MKINCTCGGIIVDQTDSNSNKAHMIPDKKWLELWDAIDAAIEQTDNTPEAKEAACMHLRKTKFFSPMWECSSCGKLYIDQPDGTTKTYSPDNQQFNKAFDV